MQRIDARLFPITWVRAFLRRLPWCGSGAAVPEHPVALPREWLRLIDDVEDDDASPALARRRRWAVSSSEGTRRAGMHGRGYTMPEEGDASEDGHPCESALEFRRLLRCWGMADEIPADVLDLCIALAWIGKAVSRTDAVYEFRDMGVDPNTWQIIAGMASEHEVAVRAMAVAMTGEPDSRRGPELAMVRQSEAFRNAYETVARAMEHVGSSTTASRRWTYLRTLADGVIKIELPKPTPPQVVSLAAARRRLRAETQDD